MLNSSSITLSTDATIPSQLPHSPSPKISTFQLKQASTPHDSTSLNPKSPVSVDALIKVYAKKIRVFVSAKMDTQAISVNMRSQFSRVTMGL